MIESDYQRKLIAKIKKMFPGCFVLKNDAGYLQGVPDWVILYKDRWAMLEIKKDKNAKHRPNQDYYISYLNDMSYAAFAYPENEEDILDALRETLGV